MPDSIDRVARALAVLREGSDAITCARKERCPDPLQVIEVLGRLQSLVLERIPAERLEADLEVAHGLLSAIVGPSTASELLDRLPEIRRCLAMDVEAAFQGDPAAQSVSEVIAAYPSVFAISTYRIAHRLYVLGEPVVARIMSEEAHARTGIDIHPGARIGCHFFIDHGTGVVIGETCEIGNRVKMYHGVTLGAFSNKHGRADTGQKRHPTIEDEVTIYPNATILGGDTVIGARSVIGGNAWLTRSVPPGSRVQIELPKLQVRPSGDDTGGERSGCGI